MGWKRPPEACATLRLLAAGKVQQLLPSRDEEYSLMFPQGHCLKAGVPRLFPDEQEVEERYGLTYDGRAARSACPFPDGKRRSLSGAAPPRAVESNSVACAGSPTAKARVSSWTRRGFLSCPGLGFIPA